MSNYSPVSSEAKAFRKGIPRLIENREQENYHALGGITFTKSRAVNYKRAIDAVLKVHMGMVLNVTRFVNPKHRNR